MNSNSENKGFVAYEYKNINVTRDSVPLYEDCYRNFGWSLVSSTSMAFTKRLTPPTPGTRPTCLTFPCRPANPRMWIS